MSVFTNGVPGIEEESCSCKLGMEVKKDWDVMEPWKVAGTVEQVGDLAVEDLL